MKEKSNLICGKVYVVGDNIDTDQIIPAQYLNLVPTIPEEYEKLGSYAMAGLSDSEYATRFVPEGQTKTPYSIVIAGRNFGCGSSREHAPIALGAAGCKAVVAESFARIFFRNCVATGELYPIDTSTRLCELLATGDQVEVNLAGNQLAVIVSQKPELRGMIFSLRPLGEAKPVIDAGGIFNYARKTGMIKGQGNHSVKAEAQASQEPRDDEVIRKKFQY